MFCMQMMVPFNLMTKLHLPQLVHAAALMQAYAAVVHAATLVMWT